MNINILAKVTLVAVLVVAATFSVMKLSKADTSGCDARSALAANIVSTGESGGGALAVISNNSDCSFNVSLDSFKTSDNSRYDSKSAAIGPRQSLELHINVPDCQYRLELSSGSTILDSRTVLGNMCGASASTFVNLNFIAKDVCTGNPVSNALVTIDQNFGNGSTRTTDGGGFSNFGVLTNKTIGWSVSANGFNFTSNSISTGTSDKTVNV